MVACAARRDAPAMATPSAGRASCPGLGCAALRQQRGDAHVRMQVPISTTSEGRYVTPSGPGRHRPPAPSRRGTLLRRAALGALLLVGATGCSADWIPNFGFPN